ncbi:MAG: DUF2065 domain-containing protein [Nitrospinota bacterium]
MRSRFGGFFRHDLLCRQFANKLILRLTMSFFLTVVGVVLIVEGLAYFAFPEKMKDFMRALPAIPNRLLRGFGLMLMICGLVLAYIGKSAQ